MGLPANTLQFDVNFPITFSKYQNTQITARPEDHESNCSCVINHVKTKRLNGFTGNCCYWSNSYNGATAEWFAIGF